MEKEGPCLLGLLGRFIEALSVLPAVQARYVLITATPAALLPLVPLSPAATGIGAVRIECCT